MKESVIKLKSTILTLKLNKRNIIGYILISLLLLSIITFNSNELFNRGNQEIMVSIFALFLFFLFFLKIISDFATSISITNEYILSKGLFSKKRAYFKDIAIIEINSKPLRFHFTDNKDNTLFNVAYKFFNSNKQKQDFLRIILEIKPTIRLDKSSTAVLNGEKPGLLNNRNQGLGVGKYYRFQKDACYEIYYNRFEGASVLENTPKHDNAKYSGSNRILFKYSGETYEFFYKQTGNKIDILTDATWTEQ